MKHKTFIAASIAALLCAGKTAAEETVFIGILNDTTGPTAQVGREFADAKTDAIDWINAHGGVNGKKIEADTVDYAYKAPAAIAAYKKWMSAARKPVAIYGYGTADTEALTGFITADKVVYLSHSFSALLTDPTGASKRVEKPTPYNFFHGPSYSDACRANVQHFNTQWKIQGKPAKPKFVYMHDNHPYPNAPKEACLAYAAELGFEVLPAIQYSMRPGDFKAQCLTLKESGADMAYLANSGDSNVSLLKSCATVGVGAKLYSNVWGYSEIVMAAAGASAPAVIAPFHVTPWGMTNAPGAATLAEMSGGKPRTPYYIAAVCTVFYLKEAMEWADKNGGLNGDNIRKGFYQKQNWAPKGFEGVCAPATWTAADHRSVDKVTLWESLFKNGKPAWKRVADIPMPREAKWFAR